MGGGGGSTLVHEIRAAGFELTVRLLDDNVSSVNVGWYIGRLKVNIGNVHFKQKQFAKAIKNYRMALDQVPNTHASMKYVYWQYIQSVSR